MSIVPAKYYILKLRTFGIMLHLRGSVKLLSIFVAILIAVGSLSIYLAFFIRDSPQQVVANGGVIDVSKYVNMSLNVTVTNAQGKVVANRYLPHDLLLNNFYYMMLYPFLTSPSYPSSWDLKNTAGSLETFCDVSGCADNPYSNPPIISVGSGTKAPAVTDYNLTTFVAQMPAVPITQTYYGSTYANTTVSSTMTFATAKTISEAGLIIHGYSFYYMVAHDTFTSVNVPANGAITIAYTIGISDPNQVFTLNFVNWVLSLFGAYTSCYGSTQCVSAWAIFEFETTSGVFSYGYDFFANNQIEIGIGTSSAAPVWTQNNLQSQIGSLVFASTPSYVAGTNTVYFSASINVPSAATIAEAAVFTYSSSISYTLMSWRLTFNGVTVPAGSTVTITFGYQV